MFELYRICKKLTPTLGGSRGYHDQVLYLHYIRASYGVWNIMCDYTILITCIIVVFFRPVTVNNKCTCIPLVLSNRHTRVSQSSGSTLDSACSDLKGLSDGLVDWVMGFGPECPGSISSSGKDFVLCNTFVSWGTRMHGESLLMMYSGKHWVQNAV